MICHDSAQVSLEPVVYVLWPRQRDLDYGSRIGMSFLARVGQAYGITVLPPVEGLMWFSADLNTGPVPVPMLEPGHGEITWPGGKLVLVRTSIGWVTEPPCDVSTDGAKGRALAWVWDTGRMPVPRGARLR